MSHDSLNEHVGRLNRATITRDRYEPASLEADLPTYRASLYNSLDGPSFSRDAPQLEYRRSIGSERSRDSIRERLSVYSSSPPQKPSSKYKRSTLYARDLRAADSSSPQKGAHKAGDDWHSDPSYHEPLSSISEPYHHADSFLSLGPRAYDRYDLNESRNFEPDSFVSSGRGQETRFDDESQFFDDQSEYAASRRSATLNNSELSRLSSRSQQQRSRISRASVPEVRNSNNSGLHTDFREASRSYISSVSESDTKGRSRKYNQEIPESEAFNDRSRVSYASRYGDTEHESPYDQRNLNTSRDATRVQKIDSEFSVDAIRQSTDSGAARKRGQNTLESGEDEEFSQAEIDRLILDALTLQDYGRFDDAHLLLQKVERLRNAQRKKRIGNETIRYQPRAPRRASLVLQELRQELDARHASGAFKTEELEDESFESISDVEETYEKSSAFPMLYESRRRSDLSEYARKTSLQQILSKPHEAGEFRANDEEKKEPVQVASSIPPDEDPKSIPVVDVPAAHASRSELEDERERRKEEIRAKREQQRREEEAREEQRRREDEEREKATKEAEARKREEEVARAARLADERKQQEKSARSASTSEQRTVGSAASDKVEAGKHVLPEQPPMATRKEANEPVEEVLASTFAHLQLAFPDASISPVQVDSTEAQKTLDDMERRRRQEEMLNPTKSSRLPGLRASQKNLEDLSYAGKKGYLLKLVENNRFRLNPTVYHKRYFVLSGGVLLHMKTKDSKAPRGMVSLETCKVRLLQCTGVHAGFCVAIESHQRNYTLFPDSQKEAIEWFVAIENNANVALRLKNEEVSRMKQLARMRVSEARIKQSSSSGLMNLDPAELVGKDVASDDFRDFTEATPESPEKKSGDLTERNNIGAYYDVLGVPPTAPTDVIRKAYFKLAKMFHPDKNTSIDTEKFALINKAFHVIEDPDTREKYNLKERVKHALRRGVSLKIHDENDGEGWHAGFYIGPSFTVLYWQDAQYGSVLRQGFQLVEMRYIQEVIAGEDDPKWTWAHTEEAGKRCLTILGQRTGHEHIRIELDTEESRDEILDGLRAVRCEQSMLFVQKLESWLKEGHR